MTAARASGLARHAAAFAAGALVGVLGGLVGLGGAEFRIPLLRWCSVTWRCRR